MNIFKKIKSKIKGLLVCFAPKVYPQIATLAPNELLKGRTALITGGTSGIGYEIAKAYVNAGATVVITSRKIENARQAARRLENELNATEGKVHAFELDSLQVSKFHDVFNEIINEVGKIDILVNNAGVMGCEFADGEEKEYDAVLNTNLKGTFFLSQCVAHYMKDNHIKGNILNIASSSSLRPATGAYTLSKWGIRGLTLGMARLLAPHNIVVNGLAPGPTATPMLTQRKEGDDMALPTSLAGRYILPQEIASMAVILVSDMSRMVIGDIVYMTGGAGILPNNDIYYNFD